jgi:hypothetical protein
MTQWLLLLMLGTSANAELGKFDTQAQCLAFARYVTVHTKALVSPVARQALANSSSVMICTPAHINLNTRVQNTRTGNIAATPK